MTGGSMTARGQMPDDVTRVPGDGDDEKPAGMSDETGPQG